MIAREIAGEWARGLNRTARAFARVAGVELLVMALALGLGVALAQSPIPRVLVEVVTTFNGTTPVVSVGSNSANFNNIVEPATVSATAATGTINFDVTTQSVLYYTSNSTANWTLNFRASSGTSLNTALNTGESVTVVFMATNGSTAYYASTIQIDGSTVTPKWIFGSSPSSGNASSIDAYTFTIIKTGSATYTVLASQIKYA